ncbi:MAG: hypothetical protein R3F54_19320 [Alphaproteobacteria bacterium]
MSRAIASFRPAIIASEAETTASDRVGSAFIAASSVRNLSSSEAASDMAKIYHVSPGKPTENGAMSTIYPAFARRCVQHG